jgi:hypothetical protein
VFTVSYDKSFAMVEIAEGWPSLEGAEVTEVEEQGGYRENGFNKRR